MLLDPLANKTADAPDAARSELFYGYVTRGVEAAFAEACLRLQLTPLQEPRRGFGSKSCGGRVHSADGSISWLKVSGIPAGSVNIRRDREKAARHISGVRTPQILASLDWTSGGVDWYATSMTLAPSPTIKQFVVTGSLAQDDRWISSLRDVLNQIAAIPTSHHRHNPEYVASAILTRFGPHAPRVATEWRTAHGDMNWANLTAPELMLFDWETWGLAPRAYDISYLMVHSIEDCAFMYRLEREFACEFETQSGCVGLLVACAEMLNNIEVNRLGMQHAHNVEDIARRGLNRHFGS